MKYAITGNIGAGKSTFIEWLKINAPTAAFISMDEIINRMYREDEFFIQWALVTFGTREKSKISEIVSKDHDAYVNLLDATSHLLANTLEKEIEKIENFEEKHKIIFIEIPLLFEYGIGIFDVDKIIFLNTPKNIRLQRTLDRDSNYSKELILSKMDRQLSDDTKAALSDIIIDGLISYESQKEVQELLLEVKIAEIFNGYTWNAWIKDAYSQKHRGYHGINHLIHLFSEFEKIKYQLKDPIRFAAAILFHDFVYETDFQMYPLNEKRSVKSMFEWAKKSPSMMMFESSEPGKSSRLAGAAEMIMATKNHNVSSEFIQADESLYNDACYFLDLDLSQLASENIEDVINDQIGIWKEFHQYVPLDIFCMSRMQVLQSFKNRPSLFLTDTYKSKQHLVDRNINVMIDELEKWTANPPKL